MCKKVYVRWTVKSYHPESLRASEETEVVRKKIAKKNYKGFGVQRCELGYCESARRHRVTRINEE